MEVTGCIAGGQRGEIMVVDNRAQGKREVFREMLAETEDPNLAAMREAMFQLDDDYREPLVLQVLMGHSTKEIAELMGIKPGAVLTRLHRARIKLKHEVDKEAVA